MKLFASIVAAVAVQSSAFVAVPQSQRAVVSSTTEQSMGLFDFFSEDGYLNYTAFGRNGLETIQTDVEVHSSKTSVRSVCKLLKRYTLWIYVSFICSFDTCKIFCDTSTSVDSDAVTIGPGPDFG